MSDESPRRVFRWQTVLQNASQAVFVLDRRRRLLFVNQAWEACTGLSAERARGLLCRRPRAPASDILPEDLIAHLLTPPPEVLRGTFARVRRLFHDRTGRHSSPIWWDVEFFPVRQGEAPDDGHLVLGRIRPLPAESAVSGMILPATLVALRRTVASRYSLDLLDSSHASMQRLVRQVRLALEARGPVLLVGEKGTGKETTARIIHHQGRDRESAFAALDCETLPPDAVTAVLFGNSPALRSGVGTLYLHQVAALPRDLQLLLCQRLASEEHPTPRLLAGLSSSPDDLIRQGKLLEELAALLSPLTLSIPPLRDRPNDLPHLVERMLARLSGQEMTPVMGLTPAAWAMLREHAWPGNLAELYSVLADSRRRASEGRIDVAHLPAPLRLSHRLAQEPGPGQTLDLPLPQLLEQVERRMIELALRRARGNRSRAAEILGIYRSRLLRRMEALGMTGTDEGEAKE